MGTSVGAGMSSTKGASPTMVATAAWGKHWANHREGPGSRGPPSLPVRQASALAQVVPSGLDSPVSPPTVTVQ